MTVGTRLILPGIAPVGAGARYGQRRVSDSGVAAGRFDERAAIVSGAQPAQAELGRGEVVDTGGKAAEIAANQIELHFVEGARAGGSAKVYFAAGILSRPGDSGGEVEEFGHFPEIWGRV